MRRITEWDLEVVIVVVIVAATIVAVVVVGISIKNRVWIVAPLEFMNGQREGKVPTFFGTIQPPTDLRAV